MSDCRVIARWRELGFYWASEDNAKMKLPITAAANATVQKVSRTVTVPEWFVVLLNKVLIHHRNLHSQSAALKATVVRVKPSSGFTADNTRHLT